MRGPRAGLEGHPGEQRGIELGGYGRRQIERHGDRALLETWRLLAAQDPRDSRRHVPNVGGSSREELVVQRSQRGGGILAGVADRLIRRPALVDGPLRGVQELRVLGHHRLRAKDLGLLSTPTRAQALP